MTDDPAKPAPRAMPSRRDPQGNAGAGKGGKQGWADGLRKLYDGVVSEPLPDSFEDLLKRLDKEGND
ncbi:NepR family anti-sigma factor [Novosphingobium sp. MW5]|nr:NepR family anti-sigma factor [Novosphingobium sp. MW5]